VADRDTDTTAALEAEEKRLREVFKEIGDQIAETEREVEWNKAVVRGTQSHISDEYGSVPTSFAQLVDLAGGLGRLRLAGVMYRRSLQRLKQLKRLSGSAYFGRIDFKETSRQGSTGGAEGDGTAYPVYIGTSSLTDRLTGRHLIFDWRAPISSVYYDYELGKAKYESPAGTVYGEVLLKRHFKIKEDRILFMYDNDLTIFDEILMDTLGKATGDRMRAIVNTIQREQNRVIRREGTGLLLVQGCAGSGKTSIALHRAAYLLYKHRDTMRARDIIMITPNRIFADYTSPVLPELGEEPLVQLSFSDLAKDLLTPEPAGSSAERDDAWEAKSPKDLDTGEYRDTEDSGGEDESGDKSRPTAGRDEGQANAFPYKLEDFADQLEYLLDMRGTEAAKTRAAGIRLKSGEAFARVLEAYSRRITSGDLGFPDLVFRGKALVSREEVRELVSREYAYLPFLKRVERAKRRMKWVLDQAQTRRYQELRKEIASDPEKTHLLEKDVKDLARAWARQEFEPLRNLVSSWKPLDLVEAYKRLYSEPELLRRLVAEAEYSTDLVEEIRAYTLEYLTSGVIPYEDLGPLLYLKGLLEGLPQARPVRHVIVDEAQDYGAIQFKVLKMAFPAASFTVLGDLNQALSPASRAKGEGSGYEGALAGLEAGKDTEIVQLTKSYRSTKEITEFTKAILDEGLPIEAIERPGEKPVITEAGDRKSLAKLVAADIRRLQAEGFGSIAVICKTARESWIAHEDLKEELAQDGSGASKIRLVTKYQRKFVRGILVIPSYLSKGLEFEAVIVYNAGEASYSHPEDREVLYTACSRALHRLHLCYTGRLSPLLSKVDRGLYEVRRGAQAY